jgi:peroxiredoxin
MPDNLYELPADLPVPSDDGAADHLTGLKVPSLTLDSTQGGVDLAELAAQRLVLYLYPRTGRPGQPVPAGWDSIPGARGCTPESCAFRDSEAALALAGARLAGLSAQPLDEQIEFATRNRVGYPLITDPTLELAAALTLPTFEFEGQRLYKRLTLIAEQDGIAKVFYPVFPPDQHPAHVLAWLHEQPRPATTG